MLMLAACGRIGFTTNADDSNVDSSLNVDALDSDAALMPLGPFAPPTRITGINSGSQDYGPSISSDGDQLLFASDRGTSFDLYRATRTSTTEFTDVTVITELRTSSAEYDAEISSSGLELYFISSAQPAGLRCSTRATVSDPWEPPTVIALGAGAEGPSLGVGDVRMLIEKNGDIEEWMRASPTSTTWEVVRTHAPLAGLYWPAFGEDGLEVFVTRKPGDELLRATRATLDVPFGTPQRYLFGTTIDDAAIYDPDLSRDGRTLYLSINAGGSPDLHVTTR